jgi:diguanylate cyclase (GGDEF)-like protein
MGDAKDPRDVSPESWPEPGESTLRIPIARVLDEASRSLLRGLPGLSPTLPPGSEGAPQTAQRNDTPKTDIVFAPLVADRATLTLVGGPGAGTLHSLDHDVTSLGRMPGCTIVVDDPSVSRRHACLVREPGTTFRVEDLDSANGTFVNGQRVRRASLASGDRIRLGRDTHFRFALLDREEETLQRRLFESSTRDELTGLPNRRGMVEHLRAEIAYARRHDTGLGVLMIDLDRFKAINDTHGHLAGDEALRKVAAAGQETVRAGDLLARYGGEELVAALRAQTMPELSAFAERLRRSVASLRVEVSGVTVAVTVSIGAALLEECSSDADEVEILARADARMYLAKLGGRNRVCSAG